MGHDGFSWKYEVVLNIAGHAYNDIIYFVIYRIPSTYSASFARMCIVLPPYVIYEIKELVGRSRFPHVNIEIYSPDDAIGDRVNIIGVKPYRILNVLGETKIDTVRQQVILQLVNPVLHKMATTHLFDKRVDDKSGKQILDRYHEFLRTQYGDNFQTNYICGNNDFFDHEYEETLIHSNSDIQIPYEIIQKRFPSSFYPVYFFDDFYFPHTKSNKPINIFYTDFSTPEHHTKASPFLRYGESVFSGKTEKIVPLGDITKQIDKFNDQTSRTFIDSENMVCLFDRKESGKKFQIEYTSEEVSLLSNKSISNIESHVSSHVDIDQSGYEMNITYPDSKENLKDRINNSFKLIKKGPVNLHYIDTVYGLIDWVHFGYRYALDPDSPDDYRFVPFNIINIFKREYSDVISKRQDAEETPLWCKYYCKAVFFEFIDDDDN